MQRIVVPGEKINDTPIRIDNTLTDKGGTFACILGIYDEEKKVLVPLEGLWLPRQGDTVIGVVEEDRANMYIINLNAPYKGIALSKFMETELSVGDMVVATVKELEKGGTVMLLRPQGLRGGKLMSVKPSKVPRIIGKSNTMIRQIIDNTGTSITIGLNGVIWLKGGNIDLAADAILRIEEEAHTSGLTERIGRMLSDKKVK
ncbi:MAG: KH domain-containing protein [Candidatus Marsarchaeota archaeon]|nr:KH domain-containing protein [Candidatus Marsarchaeota archaeon]MCL5413502.1 KH domain-containing protein [Candidatus Marsarchaeota archaeon]